MFNSLLKTLNVSSNDIRAEGARALVASIGGGEIVTVDALMSFYKIHNPERQAAQSRKEACSLINQFTTDQLITELKNKYNQSPTITEVRPHP